MSVTLFALNNADVAGKKEALVEDVWHARAVFSALQLSDRGSLILAPVSPPPEFNDVASDLIEFLTADSGRDLFAATLANRQTVEALERWIVASGAFSFVPYIWTEGALRFHDWLAERGQLASFRPKVSAGLIRQWNTKIGSEEIGACITNSVRRIACSPVFGRNQLNVLLCARGIDEKLVVKRNEGAGGAGIVLVPGGREIDDASYRALSRADARFEAWKSMRRVSDTFVVQEFVERRAEGGSYTVDIHIDADDQVAVIGITEQILDNFIYVGARWTPGQLPDEMRDEMLASCGEIGAWLAGRGYVGYCNIDFVRSTSDELYYVETNVRCSAPLPLAAFMCAVGGTGWWRTHSCAWTLTPDGEPDSALPRRSLRDLVDAVQKRSPSYGAFRVGKIETADGVNEMRLWFDARGAGGAPT